MKYDMMLPTLYATLDPTMRTLMNQILPNARSLRGHRIDVSDGVEAVSKVAQSRHDVAGILLAAVKGEGEEGSYFFSSRPYTDAVRRCH